MIHAFLNFIIMKNPLLKMSNLFSYSRKIALTTLFAGLSLVQAQNISNYVFSTSTTGSLDPMTGATTTAGTGNMVAGYNDDRNTGLFPIGFPFTFMGVNYTHFSANSNGQMRLHRNSSETAIATGNVSALAANTVTLAPMSGDNATNDAVRFVVTGTAPNRIFKLEFPGFAVPWGVSNPAADMQVWLYENGTIQYLYGPMQAGSSVTRAIFLASSNTASTAQTVTVAVPPTSAASATLVTNTFAAGVINGLHSTAQGSRRVLTFTPSPAVTAAPTGLTATAITASTLTLNWTDAASNETYYTVEQSNDGGLTYSIIGTLPSNATTYNVTGLLPSKAYTFRVTAASESDISKFATTTVSTTNASALLSTSTGGNWTSTSTWANGIVPTASDSVVIVDGATVTIDGLTPVCHAVRVGTGTSGVLNFDATTAATLTVNGNVYVATGGVFDAGTGTLTTHNLRLGGSAATGLGEGSLVVDGTADFNTSAGVTVNFFGTLNAKISGTPTLLDFRTVVLNKGAVSVNRPLIEIEAPFTVQGANTVGLISTHTAGVLKINGSFNQSNSIYTTAAYTIPLNGGLHLNNPNFIVTSTNGSPTVNGLLQVTAGIFNVSQTAAQVLGFGTGATFTVDGGTVNAAARINTGNVVNFNFSSGNINVATVGNSTSASPSFGITSAASIINWTGGTLTLVQRSTGTTQQDYNVAPVNGLTGGTLQIGNASTATNFNFNIRGNVPSLLVDNTTNAKTAVLGAQLNVWNSLTVSNGSTLSLNGFVLFNSGTTVTNDGTVDGTVAGSNLVFARNSAQTYSGTGTDTHQSISNQNTVGGVTFNKSVIAYRVNFFSPTQLINSNNINLGNGLTQAVTVQVGVAGYTNGNVGVFDVAPTFNLGTGAYSLIYQQEGAMRTTGIEIPASRTITNLTIADTNHVTLAGGALDVTGTLTMTAGKLITTSTNLLRIAATGTATIGGTTSFVDGPMQRTIPASLTTAGTIAFPVGKGSTYGLIELVNTGTNANGTVDVLVERFNTSTGGTPAAGQLNSLYTNGYWNITVPNGQANLDSTYARFTSANLVGVNRIAYSSTLTGVYAPVSAGPIGNTMLTNKITSSTLLEGFYALGEVITPISGNFLVGATKTAPNYTNITAALADISGKQVQGNITLFLDADYVSTSESFPINFVAFPTTNPNFTITVKPNTGVSTTISGANATTILRFANGASNYIIDGSNNNTSSQNLVIQNTNTTGAVVMFQGTALNQGVRNTVFKNTIVKAGSNTAASYGILVGGTTVGLSSGGIGHSNLLIENNNVYNTDYGVVISGSSVTNKVKQVTLRNNRIGTDSNTFFTRTYGLYLLNADSVLIENNIIFNIKQSGAINNAGIWIASGLTNSTIKRNVIKGIYSTSASGYGAYGINIASGTGVDNDSIYNNLIYDIKTANYSTTSTTWNAFGIRLASGATNLKVYYNTIHLFGAPQNGSSASSSAPLLILPGTYTGSDIRNNIFSNNTTGLAGSKHYAYWTTVSGTIPGLTFNNNNFFGGGTLGILMNANGTDVNTLTGLQTSTGANANSIAVNPTFVNDTTLIAGLGTVGGFAAIISTIDRDFNNAIRSATAPTIGAYENTVDLAGPTITYTQIANTSSTSNPVLSAFAAITDVSGVNVTTNKPRIYFKRTTDANALGNYPTDNSSSFNGWKYVEATNTSSPFSFTIDYSLLYLTGTVATGDVIEYFVTAQDLITTANVSANPSIGFVASSVANITSVPTSRNSFTIIGAPLAGTYLVGASQTSPNYTSLTQAVSQLNLRGVSAPVTFELTDASYTAATETFPIAFDVFGGMGINNPVTIKPTLNNTVSISGASNQSIFKFNGADYITIDGAATTGNTRDLTITNTSRIGNTAVIWVQSMGNTAGAIGIKVKNTKIQGDTSAVATSFGIYAAGATISSSGTGADNDSLVIENNEFTKVGYAIYASGTSLNKNKGMVISNNTIGNVVNLNTVTNAGIYVMQTNGLMMSNNYIKNINSTNTAMGDGTTGILVQTGVENATITRNVVDSIIYAGTGGYGGKGIDINTGLATSNIIVSNNMISNILGDGWTSLAGDGIVGLRILGSTGNISLLHNTVSLRGNANRSSATQSAAVYVASGVTNLLARNNIFINGIENNLSASAKAYAIASALTNPATVDINYNNYFAFGTQAVFGFLGADVTSLTAWKAALVQDVNSVSDSTSFVSLSDLHLTGASVGNPTYSCLVRNEVPVDIDGNTRLAFTYMGADEVLNTPVPVKWASFTAAKKVNDARLTWVTASESNNKGFDVQRSFDGRTFETIGVVKGAGNTNIKSTYTFIDNGVFNNAVSKVYYRLKQVDFDGKSSLSNVVVLLNEMNNTNSISAYPNPFNSDVTVSIDANQASTAQVTVFDFSGRSILSNNYQVAEGSNIISINEMSNLNTGIYFVKVTVDGQEVVIKMIKN